MNSPDRWMKVPVVSAGECKSKLSGGKVCGQRTVRIQGLAPLAVPSSVVEGGLASFRICPFCDGIAGSPPRRVR